MLSILIAIYNLDVRELVTNLDQQCRASGIKYELLCFDDHSRSSFHHLNASLHQLRSVRYKRFAANQGRAQLRNALGRDAAFPYLLFIDGDSRVVADDYISNYLSHLDEQLVLVGKTVYQRQPPEEPDWQLRWLYGRRREQTAAAERQKAPYQSFKTHHFVIPKSIFLRIEFDGSLERYGHEDTLFGLQLQSRQIAIKHLDNPLEHTGLDSTRDFLNKSKAAVKNLYRLSKSKEHFSSRLLQKHKQLKSLRLSGAVGNLYPILAKPLEAHLQSRHPMIGLFDLYKLTYLCWLAKKNPAGP